MKKILLLFCIAIMICYIAGCSEENNKNDNVLLNVNVGDYIKFGKYEQDNDQSNGKEDIEWLVLDKKEDKTLLISRYALDSQRFSENKRERLIWETCDLREWLNDVFYEEAFSNKEKKLINTEMISTERKQNGQISCITKDKLFLLDQTEVEKYFDSNEARTCMATDYAFEQGVKEHWEKDGFCHSWWIRDAEGNDAYTIDCDGKINDVDQDDEGIAVRPVMWINLD